MHVCDYVPTSPACTCLHIFGTLPATGTARTLPATGTTATARTNPATATAGTHPATVLVCVCVCVHVCDYVPTSPACTCLHIFECVYFQDIFDLMLSSSFDMDIIHATSTARTLPATDTTATACSNPVEPWRLSLASLPPPSPWTTRVPLD